MSSLLPLSLNPPCSSHLPRTTSLALPLSTNFSFRVCATSSSSSDREEIRWIREEQRWLREEQRWLREEQRWIRERDSLFQEISELKLQIQSLEKRNFDEGVSGLLQVLKEKNLIAERATLVEKSEEEEQVKEAIRVLEGEEGKKRRTLRIGSEGEEVKAMQEALLNLGFFSGEEDMEFSSFSTGTERAVKTWQSSIAAHEDGIMTAELLERLYVKKGFEDGGTNLSADQKATTRAVPQGDANGAAVASVTETFEMRQKIVKEDVTKVEASEHRVFLLGENRWEEPSRLTGRDKNVAESKTGNATTQCHTCRGEGRLMCSECDGTGEPNIEPQFMEWIDEGARCPYCEGRGYSICDACDGAGKTVV